jgi:bacillithiol system protein YtxJ
MNWNALRSLDQIDDIRTQSKVNPVLIFKHSTRCNISRTSLDRLERNWKDEEMKEVKLYFLDLISHRDISARISEEFDVEHESPQVLIIRDERSTYDRSHFDIDYTQIRDAVKS